ncbi:hypothetical protein V2J09_009620 [Rumex salicifolius]
MATFSTASTSTHNLVWIIPFFKITHYRHFNQNPSSQFFAYNKYMKPSLIPETPSSSSSSSSEYENERYVQFELEDGGCPEGSVPIRRIQEQDHIRLREHLKKYPSALNPNTLNQNSGWHGASVHTMDVGLEFAAARGLLNVYKPDVSKDQHSDSLVYVQHGESAAQNAIQADNYKKTGCIDMHCKGFVQVSRNFALGQAISPVSEYGGPQFVLPVAISQNIIVGYWPKEIFRGLGNYADEAGWGGRAHNPIQGPAPPMGSGHKPEEGVGKSCFVKEMQVVRSDRGSYEDLEIQLLLKHVDEGRCYGVELSTDAKDRAEILFGGPGGQCG